MSKTRKPRRSEVAAASGSSAAGPEKGLRKGAASEGGGRSVRAAKEGSAGSSNPGRAATNNVRALREAQLMSKAELARKAGLSPLTIDRVESGKPCRMDTKRKIILALGYKLSDRHLVFPDTLGTAGPAASEAPAAKSVAVEKKAEGTTPSKKVRTRRRPSAETRRTRDRRDGGDDAGDAGDPKVGGSAA